MFSSDMPITFTGVFNRNVEQNRPSFVVSLLFTSSNRFSSVSQIQLYDRDSIKLML